MPKGPAAASSKSVGRTGGLGQTGRSIMENSPATALSSKPPIGGPSVNAAAANQPDTQLAAQKENMLVLAENEVNVLSINDLRKQYNVLGKEFKNKVNTVQALQRNFQVLSKLCASEQEEKQKLLEQSHQFKTQLDERVETCCKLYEEIEELKTTIGDMKEKVKAAEKANFEVMKLKK